MRELLKSLFENIIDTFVISCLVVICLALAVIAFVLYPVKSIRFFIGNQMQRIANAMDYFLNNTEEIVDE